MEWYWNNDDYTDTNNEFSEGIFIFNKAKEIYNILVTIKKLKDKS